jgi:hypothetical protein
MSCEYGGINIAPYQNGINNTLIPAIGNISLPSNSDTSGTYNNISFTSGAPSTSFSGSYGNTCTAGYYTTYSGDVNNLKNVMDFTIQFPLSEYCIEPQRGKNQQFPFTTTKTYNYTYFNEISSSFNVSGKACTYIPAIKDGDCQQCCTSDPLEACYWDFTCDCKTDCSASTYYCNGTSGKTCALCVSGGYSATVKAKPGTDTITLKYTIGTTLPSGYTIVGKYKITLPDNTPAPKNLYFYNFDITNMGISIGDVSVSNIPEPPGGWDLSQFNDVFEGLVSIYLVPYLNTLIKNQAFEINCYPPPPPEPPVK